MSYVITYSSVYEDNEIKVDWIFCNYLLVMMPYYKIKYFLYLYTVLLNKMPSTCLIIQDSM